MQNIAILRESDIAVVVTKGLQETNKTAVWSLPSLNDTEQ